MNKKKNIIPKELIEKEENICFGYEELKDIEPINWNNIVLNVSDKKNSITNDKNLIVKESEEEYNKEENK